jgi:hypothetical protein
MLHIIYIIIIIIHVIISFYISKYYNPLLQNEQKFIPPRIQPPGHEFALSPLSWVEVNNERKYTFYHPPPPPAFMLCTKALRH